MRKTFRVTGFGVPQLFLMAIWRFYLFDLKSYIPGGIVTSFPKGEDWQWKVLQKKLKMGEVILTPSIKFGATVIHLQGDVLTMCGNLAEAARPMNAPHLAQYRFIASAAEARRSAPR